VIGGVTGAAAAVIALRLGLPGVVDFALGLLLGAATTSGLRAMVSGLGPGPHGPGHTLWLILHLLKYPLILVMLYLLLVTLHRSAALIMAGYTWALVAFLVSVVRAPARVAPVVPKA